MIGLKRLLGASIAATALVLACGPLDRTYTFDGGTDAGSDAPACGTAPNACAACGQTNCADTYCACLANIDCGAVLANLFKCRIDKCGTDANRTVCLGNCERTAKAANNDFFVPALDCLKLQCETACGLK
jgi:hypothetical protein